MRTRFVSMVVLALVVAGCGGGDGEPAATGESQTTVAAPSATEESTATSQEETRDEQSQGSAAAGAAGGTVVVDGNSFEVMEMYRCQPYDGPGADPQPDDLDLVAFAADSNYLSLTLGHDQAVNMNNGEQYPREVFDLRLDVVTGDGQVEYELVASNDQDGNWIVGDLDETALDGAPYSIDGDHISGGMTLVETYPNEGAATVAVTFDLEIPSDIRDCSA